MSNFGFRTNQIPDNGSTNGNQNDARYKHRRDAIGQTGNGHFRALSSFHQGDNLRQGCFTANLFCTKQQSTILVQGTGTNAITSRLAHGHGLAGQHGLINIAAPFQHTTINGDFLTRTHPNGFAFEHLFDGNILLPTITNDTRRFCLKTQQPFYRLTGFTPGPKFQRVAQIDQADNHGRCLKIDMPGTVWQPVRKQHHNHGEQPGRPGAQSHQGIHISTAVFQRAPGTGKIVPPRENQNQAGQYTHHPPGQLLLNVVYPHFTRGHTPDHER